MIVAGILFALCFLGFWGFAVALFLIAVRRFDSREKPKKDCTVPPPKPYAQEIRSGAHWFTEQSPQKVEIISYDGLKLVGYFLRNPHAKGTILLFHGYRSSGFHDFGCIFQFYYELGYSILSATQRAHGESEGKYICFGIKERFDCEKWVQFLITQMGPKHPIFLNGLSMGSSTVLMATGLPLPSNVKGVIADCGFTSPWEEFRQVLKLNFHIPSRPILDAANLISKVVAGFGFRDYSTLEALKTNRLPILFVHGEADTFVPHRFTLQNYEACRSEKYLVSVPGATHGISYLVDTPKCQAAIREFLQRYTGKAQSPQADSSSFPSR